MELKLLNRGRSTASRSALGHRRGLPGAGEAEHAHAHRRARAVRGRAAGARRRSSRTSSRGCTSCRATGRSSRRRRSRPAGRCGSTTRPSTSTTTCATPRCRRRASEDALLSLCARIFSQPLDRSKPLWELWLVEGLRRRWVRADLEDPPRGRRRRVGRRPLDRAVRPHARGPARRAASSRGCRSPSRRPPSWRRAALSGAVRAAAEVAGGALGAVSRPGEALGRAREVATGIGEVAWTALNHPPDTPFNVPPGPHRRIKVVRAGPRRVQARQVRVRHHRQRRRARGGDRRARLLPAVARAPHGGHRAEGRRPGVGALARTSRARSATSSRS